MDNTSVIYRFWEALWFSEERSIVQYSDWIWYIYETSYTN